MTELRCQCGKKLGEIEGNYRAMLNCRRCRKNVLFVSQRTEIQKAQHPHFEAIIAPTGMRANNTPQ